MLEEKDIIDEELEEDVDSEEVEEESAELTEEEEKALEGIEEGIVPSLRDTKLSQEVKDSFLDYAMSVIVSRAIPDIRDGLKPVHRRIVYGMNELGLYPNKPYKKCARIVGDVMGKYHPHGDAAIYSSLARLAQPFSIRYTLVDGHGNFGSVDGDEPAAMRYTEARMTKISLEMVRDIKENTVDFMDNYDGQEKEPVVLPSRFPNLLVNGSSGIAVGMATNIPPHNLGEVINAVKAIAANPDLTPLEIMTNYLYGPDFPTGGIILGRGGIRKAYETGTGSIILRSRAEIVEHANGKKQIIVTEIPYQVNKATMIENIAKLARDKVIEGITDIRDETNKEGMRVVIELRRDAVAEVVLNRLYKLTQLQVSYGIIMLSLVNGEPKVLPINEMLKAYLDYQVEVVERRTRNLLKKAEAAVHILEGLKIATDNIEEVVRIIKESSNNENARNNLMNAFGLDEIQAREILDMRLSKLTGLEKEKIEKEIGDLYANIAYYKELLESREKIIEVVDRELDEIKDKFSDERRTEISNDLSLIDDEDLIPQEDIVITLTHKGYIKRLATDTFRTQNRGGRGVKGIQTNEEDVVDTILYTKTHTDLLFFTNFGKVYRIRGYRVPEFSRTSKGLPVVNLLNLDKEEKVRSIISLDSYDENHFLFFATKNGLVKRTSTLEFESIRQNGKIAILLKEGDELLEVKATDGNATIGLAASNGKMVKFDENDVRTMGRTASGVKGMNVDGSILVGLTTSLEGDLILSISENGFGKKSPFNEYRLTKRGSKGVRTINATDKTGRLVSVRAINGDEDLMIITQGGIVIRTPIEQIRQAGRNTQGVKVIRLGENEIVSSIAIVDHQENEEEQED